jgi:hypothetical protein
MRPPSRQVFALTLALVGILVGQTACQKTPTAAEGVAGLEKAFPQGGNSPAIGLALAAAKTNDLGVGVVALQEAKRVPGLSAEQLMTVEQASQALTAEIVRRAAAGDAKAKADLELIERSRSQ